MKASTVGPRPTLRLVALIERMNTDAGLYPTAGYLAGGLVGRARVRFRARLHYLAAAGLIERFPAGYRVTAAGRDALDTKAA